MSIFSRRRPRSSVVVKAMPGPMGPQGPMGMTGEPGRGIPAVSLHWVAGNLPHPADYPAPSRAHGQDAGWDLPTLRPVSIPAGKRVTVDTGWALEGGLPAGSVGLVLDRSGLAAKHGVTVLGGVIDPGYTGSIRVVLLNTGQTRAQFAVGDRIAQLVVLPAYTGTDTTERGADGFGSTGIATPQAPSTAVRRPRREDKDADADVDMVNHPPHYGSHPVFTGEAWEYTRHMYFGPANAFKYPWRCTQKGRAREDLAKARWYVSHSTEDASWAALPPEDMVQGLRDSLTDYVKSHPAAQGYYRRLDNEGGLTSPYVPELTAEDKDTRDLLVLVESSLVCFMVASGERAVALATLDRLEELTK